MDFKFVTIISGLNVIILTVLLKVTSYIPSIDASIRACTYLQTLCIHICKLFGETNCVLLLSQVQEIQGDALSLKGIIEMFHQYLVGYENWRLL